MFARECRMDRRIALAAALAVLPTVAAAAGGEKKKGGGVQFLQIKPILATIIRRNGTHGVVTVECGLDVPDEKLRTLAEQSQPRLRAAFAGFIQAYAGGLPAAGVPDADHIARELQRLTDMTLNKKGAKLLLGTILLN
jgi:hypothetical protein